MNQRVSRIEHMVVVIRHDKLTRSHVIYGLFHSQPAAVAHVREFGNNPPDSRYEYRFSTEPVLG